jgi:phosphate ABC transporter permease protein PstC
LPPAADLKEPDPLVVSQSDASGPRPAPCASSPLHAREEAIRKGLLVLATSSIGILALITIFVFSEGLPLINRYGWSSFIYGMHWAPTRGLFGIWPMIVGTLEVTLGALLLGVPVSILVALYLAEFAEADTRRLLKPLIELLAAIPSVVYGFIGMVVVVPFVREWLGGTGFSVLSASVILAVMILPTVISIAIDAILAVPPTYREGALALGATPWQTAIRVVLPAARSGLITAVILGMGRAMGETMAVIMVAGNAVVVPGWPTDPCRTLTSNIAIEMAYATGRHQQALFATGVVLFLMILALNTVASLLVRRR